MRLFRYFAIAACAALACGAILPPNQGAARAAALAAPQTKPQLASHKATYQLTLVKTVGSEGVRAARGTMIYTLTDRCEGYTIESDVSMHLTFADGNTQKVDQRYAAWEGKSGRSSTFSMQTLENDKPGKSYRGSIALEADGSGTATYESDQPATFKLPKGTMLSTAHTIALLEHAAAGNKFFRGSVIDGSFDQGPALVSAVISGARDATALDGGGDLSAGRYWPMSLAYFPESSKESLPEYQLGMDILPSGISRSMVQDFGQFAIAFKLTSLEPVKAGCE